MSTGGLEKAAWSPCTVAGFSSSYLSEDVYDAGVPRPHRLVGHDGQLHQRDVVPLVAPQLQSSVRVGIEKQVQ